MFMSLLTSRLGKILGAVLLATALFFGLIQYGKIGEQKDQRIQKLEEYTSTKQRIEDVKISPSRDAAVERLRGNGLIREGDM